MSRQTEIEKVDRYLEKLGYKARAIPGNMPGEGAAIIRISDDAYLEQEQVAEPVAAAAHLRVLLSELEDNLLNEQEFHSFGGTRCREMLAQHLT